MPLFGFLGRSFGKLGKSSQARGFNPLSPNRSIFEVAAATDATNATGAFGASISEIVSALDTPAATGTTFDPANKSANLALSNGNLTATATASATSSNNVRSVASHSSEKLYAENKLTTVALVAGGTNGFGIVVAGFSIGADGFLGVDVGGNSLGYYADGKVYLANTALATIQIFALNDTICMAVDRTANLIWFRTNAGNWNNSGTANPATGVGGISIATLSAGAIFAAAGLQALNDVMTVNFGATAYAQTPPAGFGNWGSGSGTAGEPLGLLLALTKAS